MAEVTITQKALNYQKFFKAYNNGFGNVGTIPVPVPTITDPALSDGVIKIGDQQLTQGANGKVLFYGVGTSSQTFAAKLIGWSVADNLWVPVTIASLTATLTSAVGVAGQLVTASENFATFTITSSLIQNGGYAWAADAAVGIQLLQIANAGFQRIQLLIGAGTATSGNALLSLY